MADMLQQHSASEIIAILINRMAFAKINQYIFRVLHNEYVKVYEKDARKDLQ